MVCPKFHWLIFHAEDHAEASIPGYHLRVGFWRVFERNRLDYGGDTAQGTEAKRCITGCRITSESACQLAVPKDKVHARHLNRLRSEADNEVAIAAAAYALIGIIIWETGKSSHRSFVLEYSNRYVRPDAAQRVLGWLQTAYFCSFGIQREYPTRILPVSCRLALRRRKAPTF